MTKSAPKFFIVEQCNVFDTQEDAAAYIAQHSGEVRLIRGIAIEFAINREPTVTFGSVKKPRKSTTLAKAKKEPAPTRPSIHASTKDSADSSF